jgi:hypothetical protein
VFSTVKNMRAIIIVSYINMEASKKTKKIIFKKSQACVFMLQGITIGDTEHLIGSSADCWIFLYDLSGDQPKA